MELAIIDWSIIKELSHLRVLDLTANQLSGGIDLEALSPQLRVLNLADNQLNGSTNLTSLPLNLMSLNLAKT